MASMAELQGKATGDQKEHKHSLHFLKKTFLWSPRSLGKKIWKLSIPLHKVNTAFHNIDFKLTALHGVCSVMVLGYHEFYCLLGNPEETY